MRFMYGQVRVILIEIYNNILILGFIIFVHDWTLSHGKIDWDTMPNFP